MPHAVPMWARWRLTEQVPGTYLFHLHEEVGCIGSRWMTVYKRLWLQRFTRALSFDRPGTTDVITHLCSERACTPGFALEVSLELSLRLQGYTLAPSSRGGPTDIRNYIGLIPECTNISIGYHQQHTRREWQDVDYLYQLRDAMVDFGHSPFLTQPRETERESEEAEDFEAWNEDELASCF